MTHDQQSGHPDVALAGSTPIRFRSGARKAALRHDQWGDLAADGSTTATRDLDG